MSSILAPPELGEDVAVDSVDVLQHVYGLFELLSYTCDLLVGSCAA